MYHTRTYCLNHAHVLSQPRARTVSTTRAPFRTSRPLSRTSSTTCANTASRARRCEALFTLRKMPQEFIVPI
eukprot:6213175-Pleurochrysis_carterae.AAC.1